MEKRLKKCESVTEDDKPKVNSKRKKEPPKDQMITVLSDSESGVSAYDLNTVNSIDESACLIKGICQNTSQETSADRPVCIVNNADLYQQSSKLNARKRKRCPNHNECDLQINDTENILENLKNELIDKPESTSSVFSVNMKTLVDELCTLRSQMKNYGFSSKGNAKIKIKSSENKLIEERKHLYPKITELEKTKSDLAQLKSALEEKDKLLVETNSVLAQLKYTLNEKDKLLSMLNQEISLRAGVVTNLGRQLEYAQYNNYYSQQREQQLKKQCSEMRASMTAIATSLEEEKTLKLTLKRECDKLKEKVKQGPNLNTAAFIEIFEQQFVCIICTEILIKPIILACSHIFCEYCITEWKKRKSECPCCRKDITSENRILILDQYIDKTLEVLTPEQKEKRNEIIAEREAKKGTETISFQSALNPLVDSEGAVVEIMWSSSEEEWDEF